MSVPQLPIKSNSAQTNWVNAGVRHSVKCTLSTQVSKTAYTTGGVSCQTITISPLCRREMAHESAQKITHWPYVKLQKSCTEGIRGAPHAPGEPKVKER